MTPEGLLCTLTGVETGAVTQLQCRGMALLAALTSQKPGLPPGIAVVGDLQVLQQWQLALQPLQVDWGAFLAPCLGDAIGQSVADVSERVVRAASRAAFSLASAQFRHLLKHLVQWERLYPRYPDHLTYNPWLIHSRVI